MAVARRSDDANTYLARVSTRRTVLLAVEAFHVPRPVSRARQGLRVVRHDPEFLDAIGISRTL